MTTEQLTFLDLAPEATGPRKAPRRRGRRAAPAEPAMAARSATRSGEPAAGEVLVSHSYPEALEFLREHGPDAVAVLHVLVAQAGLPPRATPDTRPRTGQAAPCPLSRSVPSDFS